MYAHRVKKCLVGQRHKKRRNAETTKQAARTPANAINIYIYINLYTLGSAVPSDPLKKNDGEMMKKHKKEPALKNRANL